MRFYGLALVASAIVIGACAGGEKSTTDTAAPAVSDTTAAPAAGSALAMAPITGTIHEVKMVGDDKGYRFEPANITIKAGDGIKWTMVSGAPHNVSFDPATIPADGKAQLVANMPNQAGELMSPMMLNANETYTISFANVKAGKYPYNCTPHLSMGMKGEITIQ